MATLAVGLTTQARPSIYSKPSAPNPLLKSAANCKEAMASVDLDINNVRSRLMTGGDMWWDRGTGTPSYEVPKGSKKNSLFAGSCWIGGYDAQGQLKVAAQLYRSDGNDYWPGPLDPTNNVDATTCNDWDRFWKVNRSDINRFRELVATGGNVEDPAFDDIKQWPARGNTETKGTSNGVLLPTMVEGREYAPFIDANGDNRYRWQDGDYPDIFGDQYVWWIFNDKGNLKGQTKSDPIGLEVQTSSFAYSTKDFLNDATFVNYRIINRGALTMDSTFMGTWTDADLGRYDDDYIGCDTARGLGILYNAVSEDGNGGAGQYGTTVPMIGVDFFRGPKRPLFQPDGSIIYEQLRMTSFTYFNNSASGDIGDPSNAIEVFYYMTGSNRVGRHFRYDYQGPGIASTAYGPGPDVSYVFWGEPDDRNTWSECACNNPAGDRRFVHSGGPFKLLPGAANDITIGAIWVSNTGGCPNATFQKIRTADDQAQELFDANFQIIEGPQAPRITVREMDRKLIFYMVNDPSSNNYKEQYGYNLDSARYRVPSSKAARVVKSPDSLYKFEGYRVFQVKSAEVQPADIYDAQTGEVNLALAAEVFQCDIANGITRIDNYVKNTELSDTSWRGQRKVQGKDSGIVHSFELTQDQFATGTEKRLVNYKSYYYIAVAYAYNNFAPFNDRRADSTQDIAYLESRTAAGGMPIPIVVAMPNPANGDMGTVVNAAYGDGVIIHRLEGRGNGANVVDISKQTEDAILAGGIQDAFVKEVIYEAGRGPVNVKVVDPVRVTGGQWELFMTGELKYLNTSTGFSEVYPDSVLKADTSNWFIVRNGMDTIYGESTIGMRPNEQILEKYGLSINIEQVSRPGDDQTMGNGYITSTAVYADPNKPWLAALPDAEGVDVRNWIRSGGFVTGSTPAPKYGCKYDDNNFDTLQAYENLFPNNQFMKAGFAPWSLTATGTTVVPQCDNFAIAPLGAPAGIQNVQSVDIVFTSDRSKWTKVLVLEAQNQRMLSENGGAQFYMRRHPSWTGEVNSFGGPVYATDPADTGRSYFPGYAINQATGERLCIVFTEDSYLKNENGADMIWNPTSSLVNYYPDPTFPSSLFGGKHYIYVSSHRYSEANIDLLQSQVQNISPFVRRNAFRSFMWAGIPLLNQGYQLLSLADGLIPTETRLRLRVKTPYSRTPDAVNASSDNNGFPHYSFSTDAIAPTPVSDATDKNALLDRIHAVPNPYYGYAGYENNRLDTRVRIINLPKKADVYIYSLDGSLVRRLSKDNANTSYIDWDVRNDRGLPIASGMYLIHVKAEGIGETVVKWFGAMRPLDVTSY
ncbi:MAG: T9SS type A sorting domain-containing protein [Flavipsychrobacter sp.]|nr:T9SS type A sorting domain-containing protein [Flavipsychrobacter sp.]